MLFSIVYNNFFSYRMDADPNDKDSHFKLDGAASRTILN